MHIHAEGGSRRERSPSLTTAPGIQCFLPAALATEGAAAPVDAWFLRTRPCSVWPLGLRYPGIAVGWTWRSLRRFTERSLVLTAHQRALSAGPSRPTAAPSGQRLDVSCSAGSALLLAGGWTCSRHWPTSRDAPCLMPAPGPALQASVTESRSLLGDRCPQNHLGREPKPERSRLVY